MESGPAAVNRSRGTQRGPTTPQCRLSLSVQTRGNTPSQGWTACGGEIQSVGPGRGGVLESAQSNRKYAVHSAQCNRKYAVLSAQCAGKDKKWRWEIGRRDVNYRGGGTKNDNYFSGLDESSICALRTVSCALSLFSAFLTIHSIWRQIPMSKLNSWRFISKRCRNRRMGSMK